MKIGTKVSLIAVAFIAVLALSSAFIGEVRAAGPPLLVGTGGGFSGSVNKINSVMNTHSVGDALIVVEWFGTITRPCNYFVAPNDSLANTFTVLQACVQDASSGAMKVYSVSPSVGSGSDTVSCRWAANATTQVRACYVFDVTVPGTVSVKGAATGFGMTMSVASFTPVVGSAVLATVGIQTHCAAVLLSSPYNAYSPNQQCLLTPGHGLAGESALQWVGGSTTAQEGSFFNVVWSEVVVEIDPTAPVTTTTTLITSCAVGTTCTLFISGWLVPDATHFANSLLIIILPLGFMSFFVMMARAFKVSGDVGVYIALSGLTAGGFVADLSATPTATSAVPFADVIVSGLLLFLWWWQS